MYRYKLRLNTGGHPTQVMRHSVARQGVAGDGTLRRGNQGECRHIATEARKTFR